jgi:hypothetical protein
MKAFPHAEACGLDSAAVISNFEGKSTPGGASRNSEKRAEHGENHWLCL